MRTYTGVVPAPERLDECKEWLKGQIIDSINYAYAEGIDRPEIRNWTWPSEEK